MANNIPISFGAGTASIASEDVSGVHFQRVELYGGGGGSVASIDPSGALRVSVVGTVTTTASGAGSVIAVLQNSSLIGVVTGSVVALQGSPPWANTNVGSVITTNVGSVITVSQSSSVIAVATGSVVALQGSPPWAVNAGGSVIAVVQGSSVLAVPVGSTIAVLQSSSILAVPVGSTIAYLQAPSIVGTYAEDAGHTQSDKGVFVLGVRNDEMPSVTSANVDYSPIAVGPVGEVLVANAPITKWVQGTADLRVVLGASVTALAAQGASIFTYVQAAQVANLGSASVLVTWGGGLGSILGYTIAPAGGGSNIIFKPALKTGANSAFTASINGTASVLVTVQGFIAKI